MYSIVSVSSKNHPPPTYLKRESTVLTSACSIDENNNQYYMYWITIKYELINYLSKINENAWWKDLCGSRKYPYPLHGKSLEIPRGRGGAWESIFQRVTDHVQNIESNVRLIWSTKILLAIEMRLTSLALMFLFFFELASTTISRRTMCLSNEVEMV